MSNVQVHLCQCPHCQKEAPQLLHQQMNLLLSRLDEQQRRWYAAVESNRIGRGGDQLISQISGLDVQTIRRGRQPCGWRSISSGRIQAQSHFWVACQYGDRHPSSQRLIDEAGFRDVTIRKETLTTWMPIPEEFVLNHLAATPFASEVAAIGEDARSALVQYIRGELQPYEKDGGLATPTDVNIAIAYT